MRPESLTRFLSIAFLLTAAASGAQNSQQGAPPAPTSNIPTIEEIKPGADTPSAPVDPTSYVIGPEDQLRIRVWREPDVSGEVTVRPDGKITLPLIGDLQAAGRTPQALAQNVTEKLSEFLNRPEVTVEVRAVRSKKYYITGQVNRTGAFPLTVPTTVLEALSGAGGFQQWAKRKKIVILRGNKRFKFNYNEVIEGKNLEQNIYLENGDHIIVP
jgi:polysaccharide export outer membrane protein